MWAQTCWCPCPELLSCVVTLSLNGLFLPGVFGDLGDELSLIGALSTTKAWPVAMSYCFGMLLCLDLGDCCGLSCFIITPSGCDALLFDLRTSSVSTLVFSFWRERGEGAGLEFALVRTASRMVLGPMVF